MNKIPTRKELLDIPFREWNDVLHNVSDVWIIPTGKKHDSGWGNMRFVATFYRKTRLDPIERIAFGMNCDSISLYGDRVGIDCDAKSRLVHVFCHKPFSISEDFSSISFTQEGFFRQ